MEEEEKEDHGISVMTFVMLAVVILLTINVDFIQGVAAQIPQNFVDKHYIAFGNNFKTTN